MLASSLISRSLVTALCSLVLAASAAGQGAQNRKTLFYDDFDSGLGQWTTSGEWFLHDDTELCASAAAPFPTGNLVARYGTPGVAGEVCVFSSGLNLLSTATPITIPSTASSARLFLESYADVECQSCFYDERWVYISLDGQNWTWVKRFNQPLDQWNIDQLNLTPYIGETIWLGFTLIPYDDEANDGIGWLIDNVEVVIDNVSGYCTAGTSAAGCQALLSGAGEPSVSSPSGFVVTADGVEAQRPGIFFYGFSGPQASPWGNGSSFQCVTPPTRRGPLMQTSGGTPGQCDGSFNLDFNSFWSSAPPAKVPAANAEVYLQLWYRDNASTSNQSTSLSDGLKFSMCP